MVISSPQDSTLLMDDDFMDQDAFLLREQQMLGQEALLFAQPLPANDTELVCGDPVAIDAVATSLALAALGQPAISNSLAEPLAKTDSPAIMYSC